jgi:hypothetical protein
MQPTTAELKERARLAAAELNQSHIELDAQAAEESRINEERQRLTNEVALANEILTRADDQAQYFKERLLVVRTNLTSMWGALPTGARQMPSIPDYSGLVALERALSDFSRCRELIAKNVADASAKLSEFSRAHNQ